jgi:hypothetical protein
MKGRNSAKGYGLSGLENVDVIHKIRPSYTLEKKGSIRALRLSPEEKFFGSRENSFGFHVEPSMEP